MIKSYKFIFSVWSLAAPVRFDTGLCAVVPAWEKLNRTIVDQGILQEQPLVDIVSFTRLGIICHAYNVAPAFLRFVASAIHSCRPSAIIFTTDSIEKQATLRGFLDQLPFTPPIVKTIILPNIGRDVIPFWQSIKEISPYSDVFLKLHWKDSPHLDRYHPQEDGRKASDVWSNDTFKTLLPSTRSELEEILSLFAQGICCIYPRPWPPVSDIHWHSIQNLEHFSQLLSDLSLPSSLSLLPLVYPLGNMFYGSVSFFSRFADYFLESLIVPAEPIGDDGTVLHASERIYTFLAAGHGLDVAVLYPEGITGSSEATGHFISAERKVVIFPVSSLVDSAVSQCNMSLPVLHFSVIANSIRSLTSSPNSGSPLSRRLLSSFLPSFANPFLRPIRRFMRRLLSMVLE